MYQPNKKNKKTDRNKNNMIFFKYRVLININLDTNMKMFGYGKLMNIEYRIELNIR